MAQQKQYYDEEGKPVKQYYDEEGKPITSGQKGAPPPGAITQTGPPSSGTDLVSSEAKQKVKDTLKRVGKNTAIGAVGVASGEMLAPVLAPYVSAIPGLSGATSGMISGPISSISMAAIKNLLEGNTNLTDIGGDALLNEGVRVPVEAGFKVPGMIKRGYQEATKPGSYTDKLMNQLKARFSEHTGSAFAKFIEENFAPGTARTAYQQSQRAGKSIIEDKMSLLAAQPVTLDDYAFLAKQAANKEASNYYSSMRTSTAKGDFIKASAQQPDNLVPIYKQGPPSNIIGPNGQPLPGKQILAKTIEGPVPPNAAIIKAKSIVDEITPEPTKDVLTAIIIDPKYNKLQQTAAKVLAESSAEFDKNGKLVSFDPVSFKNAWRWYQDIGNYAAGAFETNAANYNKRQLSELRTALGDDISTGIPKWTKDGPALARVWNDINSMVKERVENFFPEEGIQIGKSVLSSNKNISKEMDDIIMDNHALAKSIINPKLPRAAAAGVPIQNPRREFAATKFGKLWEDAKVTDKQGNESFNTAKFFEDFNSKKFAQSEAKDLPASRDLLYSNGTQDDFRRFVNGFSRIQQSAQPSRYFNLKVGTGAIALGAGMANFVASGNIPISGEIGAGIVGLGIGAHGLGLLMINKNTARIMVAMAEGQPLGMSERAAARIIGNVLKGEAVNLIYGDNKQVTGTTDATGKFVVPLENKK